MKNIQYTSLYAETFEKLSLLHFCTQILGTFNTKLFGKLKFGGRGEQLVWSRYYYVIFTEIFDNLIMKR